MVMLFLARMFAVLPLVVLAGLASGRDAFAAQTVCKDYLGVTDGVCGTTSSSSNDASAGGTIVTGRSNAYTDVGCFLNWTRGYNDNGGWHLVQSVRDPNMSCYNNPPESVAASVNVKIGLRLDGGQYECSIFNVDCYGTSRHKFGDNETTVRRDFYTSNDGLHSTAACWDSSTPGC